MIYGDDFVWLHTPKCAGTKVERIFRRYFSDVTTIHQDIVGPDAPFPVYWHDTIRQREQRDVGFSLGDRTVLVSIRRLPSWLISRYLFEVERTPDLPVDASVLLEGKYPTTDAITYLADITITSFLRPSLLESGRVRFLRQEFLRGDFEAFFGERIDVSVIPEEEWSLLENRSHTELPADIASALRHQPSLVYERNPYWARVEKIAYGHLMPDRPALVTAQTDG